MTLAMLVGGFIALVPSVWLSIETGLYEIAVFDVLAYAVVLGLFLLREIPYTIRALALILLGLAVGVVVFFATGDEGAGFFWVFVVPPFASLLLGLGWGLVFYALTTALVVIIGFLIASNSSLFPALNRLTLDSWIVYGANFLVANAVVTVPLGALLAGLFKSAEEAKLRLGNLHALTAIDLAIISNLDLKLTLSALLKETIVQLQVDAAAVWLSREDGQLHYFQGEGFKAEPKGKAALLSPDLLPDQSREDLLVNESFATYFAATMRSKSGSIGILEVYQSKQEDRGREWLGLLQTIAGQASIAIENGRYFEELQSRLIEAEAVRDVSFNLRSRINQDEILPVLLDSALKVIGATRGSIWLYNKNIDAVEIVAQRGIDIKIPPEKAGTGLAGTVFASGLAHASRDYQVDFQIPAEIRGRVLPGMGGVTVPIHVAERVIGVLSVNTVLPQEPSDIAVKVIKTLAEIGGGAIHRSNLWLQSERQLKQFKVLSEIDQMILSSFDMQFNLKILAQHVKEQLQVDAANIMLYDPNLQTLTSAQGVGFRTDKFEGNTLKLGEGYAGRAAIEKRAVHVERLLDQVDNPRLGRVLDQEGFTSYYGVPLIAKGEIRGVMELFHREPILINEDWLGMVDALAGRAAIAIDTIKVFENLESSNMELRQSYDATIEGWSQALDLRDKDTEGHSQRVTLLAIRLARNLGVNELGLINLTRGALLHDIGKMGIPDSILMKKDSLTEDEWVVMKKHPIYARDMLAAIGYLRDAIDIPYAHHERWDGTGYPRGLQGERIPIAARIFAIVDVYDALTSDRPYREAWSQEKAITYIREQSGKHFDPQVTQAFLDLKGV